MIPMIKEMQKCQNSLLLFIFSSFVLLDGHFKFDPLTAEYHITVSQQLFDTNMCASLVKTGKVNYVLFMWIYEKFIQLCF